MACCLVSSVHCTALAQTPVGVLLARSCHAVLALAVKSSLPGWLAMHRATDPVLSARLGLWLVLVGGPSSCHLSPSEIRRAQSCALGLPQVEEPRRRCQVASYAACARGVEHVSSPFSWRAALLLGRPLLHDDDFFSSFSSFSQGGIFLGDGDFLTMRQLLPEKAAELGARRQTQLASARPVLRWSPALSGPESTPSGSAPAPRPAPSRRSSWRAGSPRPSSPRIRAAQMAPGATAKACFIATLLWA